MNINLKILADSAQLPYRGSAQAAGYDLFNASLNAIVIPPHQTAKISTGIAVEIPDGYFGGIYARSGLATKRGLRPSNCCGIVDSDYRGPIIVALHNDTDQEQVVGGQERIAQLIVQPYLPVEFNIVDELGNTKRGASGFGDSGTH